MSSIDETNVPSYYYYIDPNTVYLPQQPNPIDDLISVYGLEDISKQVARTNADGTKAVKLRKSYKNQISDLSGKFNVIPTRENGKGGEMVHILFQENPDMMTQVRRTPDMSNEQWREQMINRDSNLFNGDNGSGINWSLCSNVLNQFERSYPTEFQNQNNFQVDDLAFDLDGSGKSNSSAGRKRKIRSNASSSIATPTNDLPEELKRRRLE